MSDRQRELPLETEAAANHHAQQENVRDTLKALDRARRRLAPTMKSMDYGETVSVASLDKVIDVLRPIVDILSTLDTQRAALTKERDETLNARRERMHQAAQEAGWAAKRLKDYDYVGCFRVNYRQERVTLRIGSEVLSTFDETDGDRLVTRLQDEKRKLDEFPFIRTEFFQSIKGAIHVARVQGKDRDNKIPIRILFPLVVLVRQSFDNRFVSRPVHSSFTEYPMAQFIYDLARFGRESWTCRDERLRSQVPNMVSIGRGHTVALPSLDGDGSGGEQIGLVWIQRA